VPTFAHRRRSPTVVPTNNAYPKERIFNRERARIEGQTEPNRGQGKLRECGGKAADADIA